MKTIQQLAVLLENKNGMFEKVTKVLSDAQVEILVMSVADTTEFGVLRCITSDNEKARKALKESGFVVRSTEMLGIAIDANPTAMNEIAKVFAVNNIAVEYMYSYLRTSKNKILLLLKVDDLSGTYDILNELGVDFFTNESL